MPKVQGWDIRGEKMKDKEKKELLKKFWLEIKEHQKKWGEQPISWHHGLEEGFLLLEEILGVDPNDVDY